MVIRGDCMHATSMTHEACPGQATLHMDRVLSCPRFASPTHPLRPHVWKYLLGRELTDPGFDYSVLSEFRVRLSTGAAGERILEKLLTHCQAQGLLQAGGRQRTDATHVLAAVRVLNRLELVAETLRAALNAVVAAEPAWLTRHVPHSWYQRYSRRIEYSRRPSRETERQTKT